MSVQVIGYGKNGIRHCWNIDNGNKEEIETKLKSEGWTIVSINEYNES